MLGLRTLRDLLEARARAATTAERSGSRDRHEDGWTELRLELARARRFGRSFALVRVGTVARALSAHVRDIDRVWVVDGETYVLLPEADRPAAEALVTRLRRSSVDAVERCAISIAAFPADGLTSSALLERLEPRDGDTAPWFEPGLAVPQLTTSPPVHA